MAVPLLCAGCNAYDIELCELCAAGLRGNVRLIDDDRVPIYAGAPFVGPSRNVIARWKDHGRLGLCTELEQASFSMAKPLAQQLFGEQAMLLQHQDGHAVLMSNAPRRISVVLVPLPSGVGATRARGFEPATVIALGLARGLADALGQDRYDHDALFGSTQRHVNQLPERRLEQSNLRSAMDSYSITVVRALKVSSKKKDQSQLSRSQRRANLRGRIYVDAKAAQIAGQADVVVLVDDVVTTGATFMECAKALNTGRHQSMRAFALLATPSAKPTAEISSFVNKHEFQK